MSSRKPRLFIGSSVESLAVAHAIQENLDFDAECTVWAQGLFRPTRQALNELLRAMKGTDFAAFVFAPEDLAVMRGAEYRVVRDNVIFELGLFMGHLGPEHCFMVAPRSSPDLHLPSDLLGLGVLSYEDRRSDRNELAALGSACNAMRRAFRSIAAQPTVGTTAIESAPQKLERLIALWEAEPLSKDRELLRGGLPMNVREDEAGVATAAFSRVYSFLDAVADTVLADGHVDSGVENRAREIFGTAVPAVWPRAYFYFTPPGFSEDEVWGDVRPPVARLATRWESAA